MRRPFQKFSFRSFSFFFWNLAISRILATFASDLKCKFSPSPRWNFEKSCGLYTASKLRLSRNHGKSVRFPSLPLSTKHLEYWNWSGAPLVLRWNPSANPCRRSVFRWRVAASFRERRQGGWEHGGEQESGRDYLRFRGVPAEGRESGGEQHLRLRVPRNEGRVQDEGCYGVPVLPVGSPDPHVDLRWVRKIRQQGSILEIFSLVLIQLACASSQLEGLFQFKLETGGNWPRKGNEIFLLGKLSIELRSKHTCGEFHVSSRVESILGL